MSWSSNIGRMRILALGAWAVAMLVLAIVAPMSALLLAPAFLLFSLLGLGYFPGEELIEQVHRRRRAAPRRRSTLIVAPRMAIVVRRAGRAIAFALAMRPPPAAALH